MWNNFDNSTESTSGGFMNDSHNSNDERKETFKRVNNVVPVMIGHLKQSNNDVQIWGIRVHVITFVGIVYRIERNDSDTKVTYEIKDETGHIKAFQWLGIKKITSKPIIIVNTYVRIYGHLREYNEKKHVLILKIQPLTNLNELTNHLLEMIYVTLKAKKLFNSQNETSNATSNIVMTDNNNLSGLTKEQTIVLKIIQAENDSENGIQRNTLKARVPRNILSDVDKITDFLISEGHIYTTLTDDHFKTT